jgi:ABC-type microcin C transport system permease subunit YejE
MNLELGTAIGLCIILITIYIILHAYSSYKNTLINAKILEITQKNNKKVEDIHSSVKETMANCETLYSEMKTEMNLASAYIEQNIKESKQEIQNKMQYAIETSNEVSQELVKRYLSNIKSKPKLSKKIVSKKMSKK